VLAACTAVAVTAGYGQQKQEPAALVVKVTGSAFVVRGGGRATVSQYMPLYLSDRLETGRQSSVEVLFDTGVNVRIEENCVVELVSLVMVPVPKRAVKSVSMELNVRSGGVLVDGATVKEKYRLKSLKVRTPTSVAAVRGTVFYAGVGDSGSGKVAVFEGKVQTYRAGREDDGGVEVGTGSQVVIGPADEELTVVDFDDATRAYGSSVVEDYRRAVAYYRQQLEYFKKQRDRWLRQHKDAFMREIEQNKREFMQRREGTGDEKIKRMLNDPDFR